MTIEYLGKYVWFYWGRDACRMLDKNLFIGLFPGKPIGEGYRIPFWMSLELSWNWKPYLRRVGEFWVPREGRYHSWAWTGRNAEVVGWDVWSSFHCGRYEKAP